MYFRFRFTSCPSNLNILLLYCWISWVLPSSYKHWSFIVHLQFLSISECLWISMDFNTTGGGECSEGPNIPYCRQLLPKRKLILIINLSLYLTTSLSRNIRWEKIPKIKMLGLVPRLLVYNNSNVGRRSGGDPNFVNNIMNLIRDLEIDWGQDIDNNQAWKHWVYG